MKKLTTILLTTFLLANNSFANIEKNFISTSLLELNNQRTEHPYKEIMRDSYRRTEKIVGDKQGNETGYDSKGNITYKLLDTNGDKKPDKAIFYIKDKK